jgi:hypothetical protein
MRFPRTSAGKNQKLADCVNYTRKRKTRDEVADHYVVALNGIKCEWNKGQSRGCQFDVRFAQLKEFSNTRCTTDSQQPLIRMVFSTMIEMVMNRRMLPSLHQHLLTVMQPPMNLMLHLIVIHRLHR